MWQASTLDSIRLTQFHYAPDITNRRATREGTALRPRGEGWERRFITFHCGQGSAGNRYDRSDSRAARSAATYAHVFKSHGTEARSIEQVLGIYNDRLLEQVLDAVKIE